ncbi:Hypothetical protein TFLO_2613 [Trichococcus flocculiformis]|uniref:Transposase n=1 Tax=Trichococcus flocculiformis TaxID=82803 RepID=A0AB38BJW8_9LACT|nr:Hypothetical protein TES5_944 [Trichococcus sp. ES5]CZR01135.1 Hypothetical protein TFLO_2613 [Trichococcus flocculiformis]SFI01740.1 hypothetical protein SAMN04488507_103621 [Trichococcus flocculiformis]SHF83185.1 hypothetical protein SAMN04488048_11349 [Trichococcus flocculiformis]
MRKAIEFRVIIRSVNQLSHLKNLSNLLIYQWILNFQYQKCRMYSKQKISFAYDTHMHIINEVIFLSRMAV